MKTRLGWVVFTVVNVILCYVLSFYQTSSAAPGAGNQPFANAVEQRQEMIAQLKDINAQLKDLTALFRSGDAKVGVHDEKSRR